MRFFAALRLLLIALAALASMPALAEDGYDLWLRYAPVEAPWAARYRSAATGIVQEGDSPTLGAARAELVRGLGGLTGRAVERVDRVRNGAIVIGTPASSPLIAGLNLPLTDLGNEGFLIRAVRIGGRRATVIAANSDVGVLYGAFRLLRLIQTRQPIAEIDLADRPKAEFRMLNHWDNLDRSIERGYAGLSLWDWQTLPRFRDPRYTDYARANASLGINGTVLNNVNSNADILTPPYLEKVRALADVFRPYGIRVYLSARFSAPMEIGGLPTADPLDPRVRAWWRAKADEIYRYVPDFGGFLVKANSEGQPGPQDYRRTHADGANMLAEAVAPHGGIVVWRAFVYSNENPEDRARQAYSEFVPLDGRFRDNVIVQVKNGPIDFQPREPFSPLFGAMPGTPLGMEFQITKEYLGFNTHLAYLGTMWEEVLDADTHVRGPGSTVARVIDGQLHNYRHTLVAGVANIGNSRSWSGSQFDQANWYAFGRFAWDPEASARDIAEEWTRMTWGNDPALVQPIVEMMMGSREAVVDYMNPLGLNHLFATGHHYGPGPWVDDLLRADWNPVYFHRADAVGIGFDRTRTGSNAVAQYAPAVAAVFGDRQRVPERFLLWFHHVGWDERVGSGRTLWDELVVRYTQGVETVRGMARTWDRLAPGIDPQRHAEVRDFLAIQTDEATWWRDASIAYFQSIARRPLPAGYAAPAHSLDYYRAIRTPYAPGH
ncbi:alpha-glucuronidase family glycosyl hydrolase [Sphingosinicella sp. LHD-64]|uniref:alpha-glucuronidase family glycosyl hydrolase n=1 Tax=Sphingosinicella sp. LHD-64 TaxID=3072139 RepID=UPI00280CEFEC|nr:alpha-glucuronidase family glycosyl hydrolase [Sphingosinicella sp. LHD-64]MDQ8758102.1 alpha-glucuronidase family glycosyl hydrolase [Sphingosinicella sp. LHD-64]